MKVARRCYESSRRSLLVGGLLIAVAAGCSSSGDDGEVEDPTTPSTASSTTTPAAATADTATTSSSPLESGFDLADLPGQVVFQGVGCAGDSEFSEALEDAAVEAGEIGSVDEAMALIDELGGLDMTMEICVMNPDGTDRRRVSEPGVDAESPGWTYDGRTVMYRSNFQWFVVGADGSGPRPWDDPTKLPWRVSPDGSSYVYEFVHGDFVHLIPVGQERGGPGEQSIVPSFDLFTTAYRWSPDGSSVLVYMGSGDCPTLWKVDVNTLVQTQLTGPGSPSQDEPTCTMPNSASWSPDGSTILFADYEGLGPDPRPYLIDADGTNLRPLVTEDFFDDPEWMMTDAAWSPDGEFIMVDVVSVEGLYQGAPGLHVVRVTDGRAVPVPLDVVTTFIDISWMPEAPALNPIPDEDIDAV